jgi:uncharacterized protein YbjQ (UPF0145 family)
MFKDKHMNLFYAHLKSAVLIFCIFLTGCAVSTGNDQNAHFIPDGPLNFESRVQGVALFYEGSQLSEPYTQIGLVTAEGNRYSDNQDVLNYLKIKAKNSGADAVINVKPMITEREDGLMFSDDKESYQAINYQGVAIRFTDIEKLPDHITSKLSYRDYQAESYVQNTNQAQSDETDFEFMFSIILGIAYVVSAL